MTTKADEDVFGIKGVTICLVDINSRVCEEWKVQFKSEIELGTIEVHNTNIFDQEGDALVSPANSFGFMDGGIDLAISERFGWDLQDRVQKEINEKHDGELLVGNAILVPTNVDTIPWLISAPTMRAPVDIRPTSNAYLAFRAVLNLTSKHNIDCELKRHLQLSGEGEGEGPQEGYKWRPIRRILCPGLGTAVGRMAPDRCAYQMKEAYDVVMRWENDGHGGGYKLDKQMLYKTVGEAVRIRNFVLPLVSSNLHSPTIQAQHNYRMMRYVRDISL